MFLEIAIVLVLIVLNGFLAMSELAVVSARPSRLTVMMEQGSRGAGVALSLAEHPGRFLSAVQIGITLVGVLSGAFSGSTLGARLSTWLEAQGLGAEAAGWLGVGSVVVAITYLALIIGELVPKQIALRNPEATAAKVAPAMAMLARAAAPFVWLLERSGRLVLRLLGSQPDRGDSVTEEEIRTLIEEAEGAGVIKREESAMLAGVMRLADRTADRLMTPRSEVEVLDLSHDAASIRRQIAETRRTRLPVRSGDADEIIGVVLLRDVVKAKSIHEIAAAVQKAPVVTDRSGALDVIDALRSSTVHMALVFDEYGHFEGVVTSGDILEAITGAFRDEDDEEPAVSERHDGSFIVSGWMAVDEFADRFALTAHRTASYNTAAGYVIDALNRIPEVGEHFEADGWRIEVIDLDGRRIDKLLLTRLPPLHAATEANVPPPRRSPHSGD